MNRSLSEVGPLLRVLVKHPHEAFVDEATIAAQWQSLNFAGAPALPEAVAEYDAFISILRAAGAEIDFLPRDGHTNLDSIYVRDASIVCPNGIILCRMGKPLRANEPAAQQSAFTQLGIRVVGAVANPGCLEGGDVVWLDDRTVAVGRGARTNDEGIRQLRGMLGSSIEVIAVPLPDWHGAGDVLHLMSLVSPVDRDLAVVYSPLLPVPFREVLLKRGYTLIEVPDEEFESMGTNVLALARRRCVMLSGNPVTRAALERAGATVVEYKGEEISVKGAGGPTCLTRPLVRSA